MFFWPWLPAVPLSRDIILHAFWKLTRETKAIVRERVPLWYKEHHIDRPILVQNHLAKTLQAIIHFIFRPKKLLTRVSICVSMCENLGIPANSRS